MHIALSSMACLRDQVHAAVGCTAVVQAIFKCSSFEESIQLNLIIDNALYFVQM
jgi:hypothetical protein